MNKDENEEHWFSKGLKEGGTQLVRHSVVYGSIALIVFLVGWWLLSAATNWVSAPFVAFRDMVGGGVEVVTDVVKDAKDSASETVDGAYEKARDALSHAKENAGELLRHDTKEDPAAEPAKCWRDWIPFVECPDDTK